MVMHRQAFTLIELLVVVAIIALLLGIMIPAVSRARDAACLIACASNLRQLATALHTYAADYDDCIAAGPAGPSPFGRAWTQVNGAGIWFGAPLNTDMGAGLLRDPYLGSGAEAYFCPGDDTISPDEQLAHIGTEANALASYAYRHLSQTTRVRLPDLGDNQAGQPARALFMDAESYGPDPSTYHSAHGGAWVNIAYLDTHVNRATNVDDVLAITPEAFESLPDMTAVFERGDQVFVNADYAAAGDPADAPRIP